MKAIRVFILAAILLLMASASCFAAWTLTPSKVDRDGHYLTWKVLCTSDGSSLAATDLVALMPIGLANLARGATMMIMTVAPGADAVAPDTTIDVTLSDAQGIPIFVHAAYSNTANTTGISLSEDFNQYPAIHSKLYLILNDIGTAGDQVTLYFECWTEDK
jgi:hypothetical protein